MADVRIPTPLRKFSGNQSIIKIEGETIDAVIKKLVELHPELKKHLYDEKGGLRSYINVFVGDTDIRSLQKEETPLLTDSVVSIVPAIAGGAIEKGKDLPDLSSEEIARYSRHIIIPEFNLEGQKRLKASSVLVVGSGGLGSPMLLYLAAAGVGRIGIVDFDKVDDSNLQRQILFGVSDVGKSKAQRARDRILDLNPHIQVDVFEERLTSENALDIIKDYDVVADGTDNFPTRYLVNDACVLLDKVNVYASIFRFDGQVTVFNYLQEDGVRGPNYRCLYPEPPPPGLVPSCSEGGVLGVLPGIIGSLQANEVIKVLSGVGDVLSGRLFLFDALGFETRIMRITRDQNNPLNGNNPTIKGLIDYEAFCNPISLREVGSNSLVNEISPSELKTWLQEGKQLQIVDVREPHEYAIVNLRGELIPLSTVSESAGRIRRDVPVVVHCKMGGRSSKAIQELQDKFGFTNLLNLKGGITKYAEEAEPGLPKY